MVRGDWWACVPQGTFIKNWTNLWIPDCIPLAIISASLTGSGYLVLCIHEWPGGTQTQYEERWGPVIRLQKMRALLTEVPLKQPLGSFLPQTIQCMCCEWQLWSRSHRPLPWVLHTCHHALPDEYPGEVIQLFLSSRAAVWFWIWVDDYWYLFTISTQFVICVKKDEQRWELDPYFLERFIYQLC